MFIRLGSLGFIDRKAERRQVYLVKLHAIFETLKKKRFNSLNTLFAKITQVKRKITGMI